MEEKRTWWLFYDFKRLQLRISKNVYLLICKKRRKIIIKNMEKKTWFHVLFNFCCLTHIDTYYQNKIERLRKRSSDSEELNKQSKATAITNNRKKRTPNSEDDGSAKSYRNVLKTIILYRMKMLNIFQQKFRNYFWKTTVLF